MNASIIGGGVTGLAAAMESGVPVYEKEDGPGGICRSYYLRPGDPTRYHRPPEEDDAYRFEVGGGHWIFGGDPDILRFLEDITPMTRYERKALVKIGDSTIPFPLQNHLDRLSPEISAMVAAEQRGSASELSDEPTLDEWLEHTFGPTLHRLFFSPFNQRYTAGLCSTIAAQDQYKTPSADPLRDRPTPSGYNIEFRYPVEGLDALVTSMAAACDIRYDKQLIGYESGALRFTDGTEIPTDLVISTLPLNVAVRVFGVEPGVPADPYTSTLVLNIGAERGPHCPDAHWQYEPDATPEFHRLGFYSNVDRSFLPKVHRIINDRVGVYVERTFLGGFPPTSIDLDLYRHETVAELQGRGYIGEVDVLDASWVETAYTWRIPGSTWQSQAMAALARNCVHQVGRYGTWHFQGIADSIRDGLAVGDALRTGVLTREFLLRS